jgi:hypothetical protein
MAKNFTQLSANEAHPVQEGGTYRLVDGIFDPNQATEVLMTLITDKIRFHQGKNLTSYERCGEPDPASTRRIEELRQCRAELAQHIADARASGRQVAINCSIEVTPVHS